jgi:hypothetical protein
VFENALREIRKKSLRVAALRQSLAKRQEVEIYIARSRQFAPLPENELINCDIQKPEGALERRLCRATRALFVNILQRFLFQRFSLLWLMMWKNVKSKHKCAHQEKSVFSLFSF